MNIAEISQKRHTCKAYDPDKKISDDHLKMICALLRNSPSSVNIQPWHYIIAKTDEAKQYIIPTVAEFNRTRAANASHLVVFCAKNMLDDHYLAHLTAQEEKDKRFLNQEMKSGIDEARRFFVGFNSKTAEDQQKWKEKQIYLSVGNLLLGAASLDIDATPMEGFDTQLFDQTFKLQEKGLSSVILVALGYRSDEDFNASLPKSRLPAQEIFSFI